jgi:hypothetical protein
MRRLVSLAIAFLAVAACGGGLLTDATTPAPRSPSSTTAPTTTPAPVSSTTTAAPVTVTTAPATVASEAGPLELLTTDLIGPSGTLVARASDEVDVYERPGDLEPARILEATTIVGTPTVLAVLEGPAQGWARVLVPGRPSGAQGWVETGDMSLFVVHGELLVDLSDKTLRYLENGVEIVSTMVAIGSDRNPTPTGSFFVTDNVTLANPDSPWGPHALGLSARSETITEYNGGDGIIGIHGTDQPESIGDAVSLGCVRVPNEVITRLHELVEVGTPVTITA